MSTKSFMIAVAAVVVLLALPVVFQTFKTVPGPRMTIASRPASVEMDTAKSVPAASVQPDPAQPAVLTHSYDASQSTVAMQQSVEPAPSPVEEIPPESSAPAVMTRMQFDRLTSGLTYEQCVQFVGSEGEFVGTKGTGEEYAWQLVEGSVSSGEATLSFQNGILNGKGFHSNQGQRGNYETMLSAALPAQRPAAPPYICRPVYDGLKDGCAYEECVHLLGMEGSYFGSRAMPGGTRSADGSFIPAMADVFVWHNSATQTTLTLSFRDGKLIGREIAKSNS